MTGTHAIIISEQILNLKKYLEGDLAEVRAGGWSHHSLSVSCMCAQHAASDPECSFASEQEVLLCITPSSLRISGSDFQWD